MIFIFQEVLQGKRYKISIEERHIESTMGRYGGGWNYRLGLTGGGRSMLISAGHMGIRITLNDQVSTIHRVFRNEYYIITFELKFPSQKKLHELLYEKKCIITQTRKDVTFKIVGVGTITILKL